MTTISNSKLPEWRKALDKCVENYQSTRAWYEENRDSPAALDDMERAEDQLANFVRKCGFSIVLSLLDEIDELQELHRSCLALRGEIEDVQEQLYEAENRNNADDEELQERRKADSAEPLAWTDEQELRDVEKDGLGYLFTVNPITPNADHRRVILLYRHAQPAPERDQVRREHAEWSDATFGDVGPIGPLKHLSKEALEAAAEPEDLSEWADMQFLLWDAQRRAGISDKQITQAMIEKLAVNKTRQWPEPKDGEPRLHIKEQPAPEEIDERTSFNAWNNEHNLPIAGVGVKNAAWLAWQARARLCISPAPVMPAELHPDTQNLVANFSTALAEKLYKAQLKYGYDADWKQDGWATQCLSHFHQHIAKGDPRDVAAYCAFMWYHGWKTESVSGPVVPEEMPKGLAAQIVSLLAHNIGDKLLAQKIWNACRAVMLQSKYRDLSQPVDPQISEYEKIMLRAGWVMVPVEPTDEMIAAAMNCEDVIFDSKDPTAFRVQYRDIYCYDDSVPTAGGK